MTTQQVTAIALRLFSIWLMVQLILNLPALILLLSNWQGYQQQTISAFAYIGIMVAFVVMGVIAVFVIYRAASAVLTKTKTATETSINHSSQQFLLQLGGAYFVIDAVANLPRSLSFIPSSHHIQLENLFWPGGLIFQLVAGLLLIVATAHWLKLFNKLRGRA